MDHQYCVIPRFEQIDKPSEFASTHQTGLLRNFCAQHEQQLQELEGKWKTYPNVSQVFRRNWPCITPFFSYPPDIRRAIYTTNSVESLNRSLRKIIKTRGGFPNEEAAFETAVSRAAACGQEVDGADSSVARSLKPFHDSVAGTDASPGEGGIMKAQNPSTSLGERRDVAPSLAHPSQQQNLVVLHRIVDTPTA